MAPSRACEIDLAYIDASIQKSEEKRMSRQDRIGLALRCGCIAAAIVTGSALAGCSSSSKVENRSTTTGQELQDLDAARNKGLITEDEYNKKREEILKRK
jgi:outer membrane murein-binding lipoprotein Lpp